MILVWRQVFATRAQEIGTDAILENLPQAKKNWNKFWPPFLTKLADALDGIAKSEGKKFAKKVVSQSNAYMGAAWCRKVVSLFNAKTVKNTYKVMKMMLPCSRRNAIVK